MLLSIFTRYSWCFVYIFINKMVATLFVVCILTIGMKKRSRCCSIHHRKTNMYHHWHRRQSAVARKSEGLRKLPAAARNGAGQPNCVFLSQKMWQGLLGIMDLLCQWLWFSRPLTKKNHLTSDLTGLTGAFLDLQIPSSSWLSSLKIPFSQLHGFTMSSLILSSRLEVEAQHQLLGRKKWLVLLTKIERK